jgi:hypothetical protein
VVIFGVTEFIRPHDGKPSYTVSGMEFTGNKVARETQYLAEPFAAPASRRSTGRTDGHIIIDAREFAQPKNGLMDTANPSSRKVELVQ